MHKINIQTNQKKKKIDNYIQELSKTQESTREAYGEWRRVKVRVRVRELTVIVEEEEREKARAIGFGERCVCGAVVNLGFR